MSPKTATIQLTSPLHAQAQTWSAIHPQQILRTGEKERKRQEVIWELETTEREFCKDLRDVTEHFIQPLVSKNTITNEDKLILFGVVEQLLPLNAAFLKMLEERRALTPVMIYVGDILLHVSEYFKIYHSYCSNHPYALLKLQTLLATNKTFNNYISNLPPDVHPLGLPHYLLKPVQRICKYPLIIKEILKHTPSNHPDYDTLCQACASMINVVTVVNDAGTKSEFVKATLALQERFVDRFALVTPTRTFLHHGPIKFLKTSFSSSSTPHSLSKPRHLFIFNDLILVTKAASKSTGNPLNAMAQSFLLTAVPDKLKVCITIPLNMALAQPLPHTDVFELVHVGKAKFLIDSAESEAWITRIDAAIAALASHTNSSLVRQRPLVRKGSGLRRDESIIYKLIKPPSTESVISLLPTPPPDAASPPAIISAKMHENHVAPIVMKPPLSSVPDFTDELADFLNERFNLSELQSPNSGTPHRKGTLRKVSDGNRRTSLRRPPPRIAEERPPSSSNDSETDLTLADGGIRRRPTIKPKPKGWRNSLRFWSPGTIPEAPVKMNKSDILITITPPQATLHERSITEPPSPHSIETYETDRTKGESLVSEDGRRPSESSSGRLESFPSIDRPRTPESIASEPSWDINHSPVPLNSPKMRTPKTNMPPPPPPPPIASHKDWQNGQARLGSSLPKPLTGSKGVRAPQHESHQSRLKNYLSNARTRPLTMSELEGDMPTYKAPPPKPPKPDLAKIRSYHNAKVTLASPCSKQDIAGPSPTNGKIDDVR